MARTRQHAPLRVPKGWTGEARALVLQLERLLDEIYALISKLEQSAAQQAAENEQTEE